MDAYLQGVAARDNHNDAVRRERSDKVKNLIRGFEIGANGEYQANERGQRALDVQDEKVTQQLTYLKAQNDSINAQVNQGAMTEVTKHLAKGNAKDAWGVIKNTPMLRKKLLDTFGASKVDPIDWENDQHLFEGQEGMNDLGEAIKDPTKRKALDSLFFKISKPDGTTEVVPVQQLMQQTGFKGYLNQKDTEGVTERFNKISQILKGHIDTPEEIELKKQAVEAKKKEISVNSTILDVKQGDAEMAKKKQDLMNKDMEQWMSDHPDATASEAFKYMQEYNAKPISAKDRSIIDKNEAETALKKAKTTKELGDLDAEYKSGEYQQIVSKVSESSNEDFNKNYVPFLKAARRVEGKSTAKYVTSAYAKEVREVEGVGLRLMKATQKFDKIPTERWDAIAKVKDSLMSLIDADSKENMQARYAKIDASADVKLILSDYIKAMSGAAVTEEEFTRYKELMFGGDWSNFETAKVHLRSFTDAINEKVQTRYRTGMIDFPYSVGKHRHTYINSKEYTSYHSGVPVTKGEEKKVESGKPAPHKAGTPRSGKDLSKWDK